MADWCCKQEMLQDSDCKGFLYNRFEASPFFKSSSAKEKHAINKQVESEGSLLLKKFFL